MSPGIVVAYRPVCLLARGPQHRQICLFNERHARIIERLRAAVEAAGYTGPIEVEIFNESVWAMPLDALLPLLKERFLEQV